MAVSYKKLFHLLRYVSSDQGAHETDLGTEASPWRASGFPLDDG